MSHATNLPLQLPVIDAMVRHAIECMDDQVINEIRLATSQIASQCSELNKRKALIAAEIGPEPIDSSFEIRRSLGSARDSIRRMYKTVQHVPEDKAGIFASLRLALESIFDVTVQLQREIGEHDASCYPLDTTNFLTTKDEVYRALDAIRAKK